MFIQIENNLMRVAFLCVMKSTVEIVTVTGLEKNSKLPNGMIG